MLYIYLLQINKAQLFVLDKYCYSLYQLVLKYEKLRHNSVYKIICQSSAIFEIFMVNLLGLFHTKYRLIILLSACPDTSAPPIE